jgi:uncharacterized protein YbaR (Trm112 family)
MDKKLLSILCCPITHKGLSLARADLLKSLNRAITAGELVNRDGESVATELSEALVTDDGKILYPINDGIPVLLEGESVVLAQLDQSR